MNTNYDVIVIGGGPAGMAAAIEASKQNTSVALIERNDELGGILNQCIHPGFGLKYFKEELTGPEYAQRLINELQETTVKVFLSSMVLSIHHDDNQTHYVTFINEEGNTTLSTKAIILAMGCRERTRGEIKIPGSRVAGVFTAGLAQRYINMDNFKPGNRFVILGSGDIGLIMARRLSLEGMKVLGVYELMPYANGLFRNIKNCLDDFNIPLHLSTTVTKVIGKDRVEAVEVSKVDENLQPIPGTEEVIPCDTLLLSIGLIPENEISSKAGVELNPATNGAYVNERFETNIPGIFSCGNVLHVHDLADNVTAEANITGKNAALYALGLTSSIRDNTLVVHVKTPIGYSVPSSIIKNENASIFFRVRKPISNAVMVVTSNGKEIFRGNAKEYKPSIMECQIIPSKILSEANDEITLSLEEGE
ncbi:MAG: FAD-dependent oxidoreductase [Solobacterium sp.]|nr:FAD-dependent oxidoreductase [Solobacterium sp.]